MLNAVILSVALAAPPCHQPHYYILPPQRYYQPIPRYYYQPVPRYYIKTYPQPIYRRPGFNFYFGF